MLVVSCGLIHTSSEMYQLVWNVSWLGDDMNTVEHCCHGNKLIIMKFIGQ